MGIKIEHRIGPDNRRVTYLCQKIGAAGTENVYPVRPQQVGPAKELIRGIYLTGENGGLKDALHESSGLAV